jgi:hypothetical protein
MGVMTAEQIAQKENLPAPNATDAPLSQRIESVSRLIQAGFDPEGSAKALGLPPIRHTGQLPVTVQPEPTPADPAPRPDRRAAVRAVVLDVVARFTAREGGQAKQAAKEGPEAFGRWLNRFYGREGTGLASALRALVALHLAHDGAQDDPGPIAQGLADAYMRRSKDELESLKASDLVREVDGLVKRWQTARPMEMADAIAALKENSHAA